jgi:PAS domain S-box-containing protein
MTSPSLVMVGQYDYRLVVLSVLISILAAYATLNLAGRVIGTRGSARLPWLLGGAAAAGIGTWSMHFTGMLAFRLPVPVWYDWPTVLLSFLPAFVASGSALFLVSRQTMGSLRAWAGSVLMGGGIGGLHYTAMAGMRLQAMCHYSLPLVTLSLLSGIMLSLVSLWLTFVFRDEHRGWKLLTAAGTLLMGLANPVMHYFGMAAASFAPSGAPPDLSHAVSISSIGIVGISIVPLMVLVVALQTSLVDRLHKQTALLDELFEQAPQAVVLMNSDTRVVRVNREFTRLFGYTPLEALGRRLIDLIVLDEFREEDQKYSELVARGQRVDAETVRRRMDGSRLPVSMVGVPVSMPGGQIEVYAIYRDITDRKRAEVELQHSFDQLRALAGRLQTAREEERARLAREIHDELGAALTAIKIQLSFLLRAFPTDKEPEVQRIQDVLKLLEETALSVHRIATELRPSVLDDLGLVAAVEWAVEEFQARTGTKCRVTLPGADIAMDPERATALFRILQETLTNVARHSNATEAYVRLTKDDGSLTLEIHDNGRGIRKEQLSAGRSLGILGMRERALLLGGDFTISGAPGKGTTVKVRIPEARHKGSVSV